MTVNSHISDLFFNHDLEHCKEFAYDGIGNRCFAGFDNDALRAEAETFLQSIDAIVHGSIPVPTVETLVADFYSRL